MKTYYIDLNEINRKRARSIRFLALGAGVCILLIIVTFLVFLKYNSSVEWPLLFQTVYLSFYVYFAWITLKAKIYIKADGNEIVFKFGIRNRSKDYILWETVSGIKIGPTYITFFKKSGRKKRIPLGWMPYKKVIEVKETVVELSSSKNIPCEIVEFERFVEKQNDKEEKDKPDKNTIEA